MNVLFVSYLHLGLGRGGLQIQIDKTASALRRLGVEVTWHSPWKDNVEEVDLCHIFGLHASQLRIVEHFEEAAKPVILSPVFNRFDASCLTRVAYRLSRTRIGGIIGNVRGESSIARRVDRVLALNADEAQLIGSLLQVPLERIFIVPNAVDRDFGEGDANLFISRYGPSDYILMVGSIESRKNQLGVIEAVRTIDHDLVVIGQRSRESVYVQECYRAATGRVRFLGHFDRSSGLLQSAFAAARVFVLPSFSEVMPLVLDEAVLSGCRPVVSSHVPVRPEYAHVVETVDPSRKRSIQRGILRAMERGRLTAAECTWDPLPDWSDVGKSVLSHYKDLLETDA